MRTQLFGQPVDRVLQPLPHVVVDMGLAGLVDAHLLSVAYTPARMWRAPSADNTGLRPYSSASRCAGLPPVAMGSTTLPASAFSSSRSSTAFRPPANEAL